MQNIGIVFGCFIPMHIGHEALIKRAIDENDKVIIAVCGYEADRGKDFLAFSTRFNLVTDMFRNNSDVTVVKIDDKKLGLDGTFTHENWVIWGKELFEQANISPDSAHFNWYTGEPSYVEKLSPIYPEHSFILADRAVIRVSGTEIRSNPTIHADDINTVFRDYLEKTGKLK